MRQCLGTSNVKIRYWFFSLLLSVCALSYDASLVAGTPKAQAAPAVLDDNDSDPGDIPPYGDDFAQMVEKMIAQGKKVPEYMMKLYNNEPVDLASKPPKNLSVATLSRVEQRLDKKMKKAKVKRFKHASHSCSSSSSDSCKGCCGALIPITRRDIGTRGFVIKKSGIYCLAEDVEFNPFADNTPAITIDADFVVLDFSEHVLSQSAASFAAFDNTTAVLINPGRNYVSVRNGTIRLFSNMGIFAKSLVPAGNSHKGILVENMTVLNCGKLTTAPIDRLISQARSSIGIDGATDVVVRDCTTVATLGTRAGGVDVQMSDNVLIRNSFALDHLGVRNGIGVGCLNSRNILIKDCQSLRISGQDLGPFGITTQGSSNVVIDGCIANDNFTNKTSFVFAPTSAQNLAISSFGPNVRNIIITNCVANNNAATIGTGTAVSAGIVATSSPINSIVIENCHASGNTATSTTGTLGTHIGECNGIRVLAGTNVNIRNSTANNNVGTTGTVIQARVVGILLGGASTNTVVEDCVASGNSAIGASTLGAGIVGGAARNIVVKNCEASGNLFNVTGLDTGLANAGILFDLVQNGVIENCTTLNNQALSGSLQTNISGIAVTGTTTLAVAIRNCVASGQRASNAVTQAAGIRVEPRSAVSHQVVVEGCIVENNVNSASASQGFGIEFLGVQSSLVLNNIVTGNGIGISLRPDATPTDSIRCIVQGNEVNANSVAGIEDTNLVVIRSNAYMNNVLYNTGGTNFLTPPPGTPIRTWTFPALPGPVVAGDIDNISIS